MRVVGKFLCCVDFLLSVGGMLHADVERRHPCCLKEERRPMKRSRLTAVLLMAGLTVVGISFAPASAAGGGGPVASAAAPLVDDVALARTVSASSSLAGYPVANAA